MYGEKRYSGKCGICAICSRTDYRRGSSEGPLCKIKINRGRCGAHIKTRHLLSELAANAWLFLFHFFSQIFRENLYTICIGDQETEVTLENNYTEL